jgi:hypothetical protein
VSVYYLIPSKRPEDEALPVLRQWEERGYSVLVQRDPGEPIDVPHVQRPYSGYADAVNHLVHLVLNYAPKDAECEWIVTGGDDMLPDPNKCAEEIARECEDHFLSLWTDRLNQTRPGAPISGADACTFGVMQPTGDRWLVNGPGTQPGSECVAGSPWMGREWCRRINGGRGPLWPEYFHCGEDEELQAVAIKYGVFWQRPDLTQHHAHWGRPKEGERLAHSSRMPAFLARANSPEEWQKMKRVLAERKAAGWPGSDPIA